MCSSDWTALGTWIGALSTAVLAGTAIWAGKIAIKQFKLFDATERHKRTVDLVRAYTAPTFAIEPGTNRAISITPMQAHALLDSLANDLRVASAAGDAAAGDAAKIKQIVGNMMIAYIALRNHLDEVDDYYDRGMIDREFYLSRQVTVITEGVAMLRSRAEFSKTSSDDAVFLDRLDKIARDYENTKTA
jgi:hypothetical protein